MRISSRRLGEFLVDRRVLSRDALDELLAREAADGTPLPDLLSESALVDDRDLAAALAHELGIAFVDPAERTIRPDVWGLVPEDLARGYLAVALERRDDGVLVAMQDPTDGHVVAALAEDLGERVVPAAATAGDLRRLVEQVYGPPRGEQPAVDTEPPRPTTTTTTTVPAGAGDGLLLDDLLRQVLHAGASDLHLAVGAPPTVRVRGELRRLDAVGVLNASEVRRLVLGVLTERQRQRFLGDGELQTSHGLPGAGRFRVHAFVQRDSVGAVFRLVPGQVPTPEQLGLPVAVAECADLTRGVVLVCGPSGSGTSTTVASLVDRINRSRACHVLTLEEPIEFLHRHQRALVNQREVGEDTSGFAPGLRAALAQDADVVVVGGIPDLETLQLVLAGAQTGHLVIAVLRGVDTTSAIEGLVESFPVERRAQARAQLAATFRGAVAQRLVPRIGGGMALACEVLLPGPAVVDTLRAGDLGSLPTAIRGGATSGMQTLDQSLADLVQAGTVALDAAVEHAVDPAELQYLLSGDDEP